MTDTTPLGTVELLTTTSTPSPLARPPGDGEPLVPLSDPTWDQTVIDWLKAYAGPTAVESPLFPQAIEYWKLPVLFPDRYVVFRDIGEGEGEDYRLIRREVFCHTPDVAVARAFLDRIPERDLAQFHFEWSDGNR